MVDRREALKKLGAAGAVVVGGSAVLSSRSVVFAASGTCLTGIPGPSDNLTVANGFLAYRSTATTLTLTINVKAKCSCGRTVNATATYFWDAQPTYTLQPPNTPPGPAGYRIQRSGNQASKTAVLTRKSPGRPPRVGGRTQPLPLQQPNFQTGDKYALGVKLTWQCTGRSIQRVEAKYSIEGTYNTSPVGYVKAYAVV